jgi:hypothetical protein
MAAREGRLKKRIAIGLLGVCFLTLLLGYCYFTRGVRVTVIDESGNDLSEVILEFDGGSKMLGTVKQGESKHTYVNPSNESDLMVVYKDAAGKAYKLGTDVYLLRNSTGELTIWLGKAGTLRMKDDSRI